VSDHLIAEANRHAKALHQMTLPTTKPNQRDIDWYIAECIDLRRQLEYEIEAKRNHLRIACEELNHLTVKTGFYERENAALRADKERLDWLEANSGSIYRRTQPYRACIADETSIRLGHFRAAIDAARKEAP
jgi:hypothetical protein